MKRPQNTGNFLFSWGLNLVMNYELGVLALILFIVRIFVPSISIWVPLGVLIFWLVLFFVVTLILTFLIKDAPSDSSGTGNPGTTHPKYSSSGKYRPDSSNGTEQTVEPPVSFKGDENNSSE